MDRSAPLRIAVIGGRSASPEGEDFAYELGKQLAGLGAIVYSGGGPGIMAAACKGVRDGGGTSVGILKGTDPQEANPYVQIPVFTGMGDMRNPVIIRSVQAAIAVEGSYGTLSEIAYTCSAAKPVYAYQSWDIPGVIAVSNPAEVIDRLKEEFEL